MAVNVEESNLYGVIMEYQAIIASQHATIMDLRSVLRQIADTTGEAGNGLHFAQSLALQYLKKTVPSGQDVTPFISLCP